MILDVSGLQRQFILQTRETEEVNRNAIFNNLILTEFYSPCC